MYQELTSTTTVEKGEADCFAQGHITAQQLQPCSDTLLKVRLTIGGVIKHLGLESAVINGILFVTACRVAGAPAWPKPASELSSGKGGVCEFARCVTVVVDAFAWRVAYCENSVHRHRVHT